MSDKIPSEIESRQFAVEEICRFYGVSPDIIQSLKPSTLANVESPRQTAIELVRDGLTPWRGERE